MEKHVVKINSKFGSHFYSEVTSESCPFWRASLMSGIPDSSFKEFKRKMKKDYCGCLLTKIPCKYGVTEIVTPHDCPIQHGIEVIRIEKDK